MNKLRCSRSVPSMRNIGVAALFLLFVGCAGMPAPVEQIAVSKAAISSAGSVGGSEYAPVEFKSAVNKMDAAEQAMVLKNYPQAKQLAEQAQVDAQLATVTARAAKAQKAAGELQEDNRILRQELDRKVQ